MTEPGIVPENTDVSFHSQEGKPCEPFPEIVEELKRRGLSFEKNEDGSYSVVRPDPA